MGWWSALGSSGQAAAISGGSGILGGLMSGIAQPILNKKNQRFAVAQTDKAWHRAMDLRNWDNEYNSPKAQMQRLQQAGISPLLPFLGKGNASGGQSAPAPQRQSAKHIGQSPDIQASASMLSGAMGDIYDVNLKKAGTDKIREEINGLKVANDKANKTWLEEQKYLAQKQGDSARVSAYEAALKNMEMNILAEMRGEAETYGGLGNLKVQEQIQNITNSKSARDLIIAQTADVNIRNKRMKEFDKLLKTMPKNSQALQTILWMILTK